MVQVYIGNSPDRMEIPTGLPIDMRETVGMIPGNPWINDKESQYDEMTCRENDRNLRNQGYMKGPQYFHKNGKNKDDDPVRNIEGNADDAAALRRILIAQHFDADKTYYLRFSLPSLILLRNFIWITLSSFLLVFTMAIHPRIFGNSYKTTQHFLS